MNGFQQTCVLSELQVGGYTGVTGGRRAEPNTADSGPVFPYGIYGRWESEMIRVRDRAQLPQWESLKGGPRAILGCIWCIDPLRLVVRFA